jgi:hypothetical protein
MKASVRNLRLLVWLFSLSLLGQQALAAIKLQSIDGKKLTAQLENEPRIFAPKELEALNNGLTTRLLVDAQVRGTNDELLAQQFHTFESRFDLWREEFVLQESSGQRRVTKKKEQIIQWLEDTGPFFLVHGDDLKGKDSIEIRISRFLNPVNPEVLKEMREWVLTQQVANSAAGSRSNQSRFSGSAKDTFSSFFSYFWQPQGKDNPVNPPRAVTVGRFSVVGILSKTRDKP